MWKLKKEQGIPVYVSIMELILSYIKEGKLLPGERLPAERKLAQYFDVNRSTVVHALDELVALGWIIRKQGSGTIVNEGKWGIATTPRTDWRRYLEESVFNNIPPYISKINQLLINPEQTILDTYTGELPLELIPSFDLPSLTWKQFLQEEHQDELGYRPLRRSIQQLVKRELSLSLDMESLLVTSGAQQALFLILQVLLKSGDSVAIEDPSFLYALPIFQAAGIRIYGVKMDKEGICLKDLEKVIRQHRVKMVMVNPTFQNPTGQTMSLKRREDLLKLCQFHQVPLLEDDAFGSLFFEKDKILPPLKALDQENVLYIGSLSKILGSTTKIGWLSAPASINRQLIEARKMMDFSLSIFPQVLANFALTDRTFKQKIQDLRAEIFKRSQQIYQLFEQLEEWQVFPVEGGFYLWASWKYGPLPEKAFELFLKEGILAAPSFLFSESREGIRFNFSRISEQEFPDFEARIKRITRNLSEDYS